MCSTNLDGAIINHVLIEFNLRSRVYGAVEAVISILAKNDDGVTKLGMDLGSSVNNLEGIEFMVVDASDINFALVGKEDLGVIAENTAVGSPIDE